jgi:hypothetical protein
MTEASATSAGHSGASVRGERVRFPGVPVSIDSRFVAPSAASIVFTVDMLIGWHRLESR